MEGNESGGKRRGLPSVGSHSDVRNRIYQYLWTVKYGNDVYNNVAAESFHTT